MILPSLPSETSSASDPRQVRRRWMLSALTVFIGLSILAAVLYLDRNDQVSIWITSLGPLGVMLAIVLMALVCLTPLPGEFLLLMDMRVYGVWSGIGVGWIGSIIGSLAAFIISRSVGRSIIGRFVTPAHLAAVEAWVVKSKMIGLLAARLLPLPSSAVNYALGILHTVSFWNYLWTGAVTAIPYYACTGLLYVGVFRQWTVWSVVGVLAMAAAWVLSMVGKRIWKDFRGRIRNP